MNIDRWAGRIAAELSIAGDERPPMDAVLLAHMDEFEELTRATRLKIPAFARALARAGVVLKSGKPYSAETLRAQINRARTRRALETGHTPRVVTALGDPAIVRSPGASAPDAMRPTAPNGPGKTPSGNEDILSKLDRLRPRRLSAFGE